MKENGCMFSFVILATLALFGPKGMFAALCVMLLVWTIEWALED